MSDVISDVNEETGGREWDHLTDTKKILTALEFLKSVIQRVSKDPRVFKSFHEFGYRHLTLRGISGTIHDFLLEKFSIKVLLYCFKCVAY